MLSTMNLASLNAPNFTWDDETNKTPVTGSNDYSTPADNLTNSKSFQDTKVGGFLNMLLANGGNIAQIIGAFNGNQPTITDGKGQTHDLSNIKTEIEKISAQKNQDTNTVLQMMLMQLQKNQTPTPASKKDYTPYYIGGGIALTVLITGIVLVTQKKTKK